MTRAHDDVYKAVEALVRTLKADGETKPAHVLEHRMYKVSWTSSSELLEELEPVHNRLRSVHSGLSDKARAHAKDAAERPVGTHRALTARQSGR
jgi:hypothetical protein